MSMVSFLFVYSVGADFGGVILLRVGLVNGSISE